MFGNDEIEKILEKYHPSEIPSDGTIQSLGTPEQVKSSKDISSNYFKQYMEIQNAALNSQSVNAEQLESQLKSLFHDAKDSLASLAMNVSKERCLKLLDDYKFSLDNWRIRLEGNPVVEREFKNFEKYYLEQKQKIMAGQIPVFNNFYNQVQARTVAARDKIAAVYGAVDAQIKMLGKFNEAAEKLREQCENNPSGKAALARFLSICNLARENAVTTTETNDQLRHRLQIEMDNTLKAVMSGAQARNSSNLAHLNKCLEPIKSLLERSEFGGSSSKDASMRHLRNRVGELEGKIKSGDITNTQQIDEFLKFELAPIVRGAISASDDAKILPGQSKVSKQLNVFLAGINAPIANEKERDYSNLVKPLDRLPEVNWHVIFEQNTNNEPLQCLAREMLCLQEAGADHLRATQSHSGLPLEVAKNDFAVQLGKTIEAAERYARGANMGNRFIQKMPNQIDGTKVLSALKEIQNNLNQKGIGSADQQGAMQALPSPRK